MTFFEIWLALKIGFAPIASVILIGSIIIYVIARFFGKVSVPSQLVFIVAFGSLGCLIGYSAGASRQSIIGTVLPTLITFISVVLGYLFSKEALPKLQPLVPYCLLVLILNAFLGLFIGGRIKLQNEEFERAYNRRLLYYERVELELEKAKKISERQSEQLK